MTEITEGLRTQPCACCGLTFVSQDLLRGHYVDQVTLYQDRIERQAVRMFESDMEALKADRRRKWWKLAFFALAIWWAVAVLAP